MSGSKKKTRVYLSKSKAGKTEDLNRVLSLLKQYDNVKVVMWDGSKGYNREMHEELIKSCDLMLVLPPKLLNLYDEFVYIGRGQYFEFDFAIEKAYIPVNFITNFSSEIRVCEDIIEDNVIDEDWQSMYACIQISLNSYNTEELYNWSKTKAAITNVLIKPMLACYKNLIK